MDIGTHFVPSIKRIELHFPETSSQARCAGRARSRGAGSPICAADSSSSHDEEVGGPGGARPRVIMP